MDRTFIRTKLDQVRDLIDRGFVYFDFEQILEVHYRRWVKPGDTVIDIGAHIGRHLGPLVELVGPTGTAIAFEPIPFAYAELTAKFTDANVFVNNVALSDKSGTSEFTFAEGAAEESGLIARTFNCPETARPTKIEVKVDTLDSYTRDLTSISFMKIDIEGGEINCLKGASETISRFRPVISVEYGDLTYKAYGNDSDTLFTYATENRYAIYDIFLNRLDDIEEWRSSLNYVYWDFILVPLEKVEEFHSKVITHPEVKLPHPRSGMVPAEHYSGATENIARLQDELSEIKIRLENTDAELEVTKEHLSSVMNSTSWKLTAPLRKTIDILRRLF